MDVIVSFKAGVANLIDNVVTPDPRRGEVRVVVDSSEGLLHFQWLVRGDAGGIEPAELDIVVMPEEADFIQTAQPGSRVMQLEFKDSTRQDLFFWMQEPDSSQDVELCKLVHAAINMGDASVEADSEVTSRSAALAAGTSTDDASSQPAGGVQAADLARILANIGVPPQPPAPAAQPSSAAPGMPALTPEYLASVLAGVAQQGDSRRLPGLAQVLQPQNVVPLLQDETVRRRLGELVEHLPAELQGEAATQPVEAIIETWRSAPFQNQLRILGHALTTGQLDFSQFGMEPLGFTAADFLSSIEKKHKKRE